MFAWPIVTRVVIGSGRTVLLGALALWLAGLGAAWAQGVQPVPALTARVMDTTATLSAVDRAALEARLAAFEAEAGPQIVVLIVATTQPEDIAAYAQRVGETWKIGRREVGDGLLLVVARDDRRLWIATAKALEGAVPDLAARQIIRDRITPAFRNGDYAAGLNQGLDALMARLRGEGLPAPQSAARDAGPGAQGAAWEDLLVFLFVAVPIAGGILARTVGRKLGTLLTAGGAGALVAWVTHSLWMAVGVAVVAAVVVAVLGIGSALRSLGGRRGGRSGPVVFGDGGWSGGAGGSGGWGGGGFASGGGGDFGGGGAGGQW